MTEADGAGSGGSGARLVVVGGGPGGYPAAFLAAGLGMRVTLIDDGPAPGGVCLHRGCIPSKALLHAAASVGDARRAAEWGVEFGAPAIDLGRLRAWKQGLVDRLAGGLDQLARQHGVEYVRGRARFEDARSVRVDPPADAPDAAPRAIAFDRAIVATGSVPAALPGLPDSPRVLGSDAALALERVPESLLVIGGGYIGLELGSVYAALGSRVTVAEMTAGLLPGADRDLVRRLRRGLEDAFEAIRLDTSVLSVEEDGDGLAAVLAGPEGAPAAERFGAALVAVGRRPNTAGLGLERTGARLDARGFVEVDARRRTADPAIYAVGDAAGEPMLAHKATHEAHVAVEAIAGRPAAWDPRAVPAVVYTRPEIAWVGLTETEALDRRLAVETSTLPWAASGRAALAGADGGATKLVLEPRTHRLLGAGAVGPGAGDLIAEAALALELGATAQDLERTVHPHPTLSETLMNAAAAFYGRSPDYAGRSRRGGAR